jgi:hypothetical protein
MTPRLVSFSKLRQQNYLLKYRGAEEGQVWEFNIKNFKFKMHGGAEGIAQW